MRVEVYKVDVENDKESHVATLDLPVTYIPRKDDKIDLSAFTKHDDKFIVSRPIWHFNLGGQIELVELEVFCPPS